MTALSGKQAAKFFHMLFIYGGVFVIGTPIVVYNSWVQDKLGLLWRNWLTRNLLEKYFRHRAYYKISYDNRIDNPDERIAEDISAFTRGALSYFLVVISSVITLLSFIAILWSISQPLVAVLIFYSLAGSIATVWFGRPLIGLNFNQLRKEADFRFGLIHVRNNVESIAFYQGEDKEQKTIVARLQAALNNFNVLIGWQRNVNFLTTGYNYFVVIIPSLVIAPMYFAGKIQFGVISQADGAFAQVLAALSIVVSQFSDLSGFIAVINRLGVFVQALDEAERQPPEGSGTIVRSVGDQVKLAQLSLPTPDLKRVLAHDLSLSVAPGKGLLIVGDSGVGKSSILRAIAGLWTSGSGSITHPEMGNILFLPQKPYMILGSLRSQLLYPNNKPVSDAELHQVLEKVNLGNLPTAFGGLDAEMDWSTVLSLGEQQRLVFARLLLHKPRYAILDEATSALDERNEERLYSLLSKTNTTFVSVGHRRSLVGYHESVLALNGDSTWRIMPAEEYLQPAAPLQLVLVEAAQPV